MCARGHVYLHTHVHTLYTHLQWRQKNRACKKAPFGLLPGELWFHRTDPFPGLRGASVFSSRPYPSLTSNSSYCATIGNSHSSENQLSLWPKIIHHAAIIRTEALLCKGARGEEGCFSWCAVHTGTSRPEGAHFQNGFIFNVNLHAEPLMTWVFNYLTEQLMLIEYEPLSWIHWFYAQNNISLCVLRYLF